MTPSFLSLAKPRVRKSASVSMLALCAQILSGAAGAADAPAANTTPPANDPSANLSADPAALLSVMADHLDENPNHVVLQVLTMPITQDDLAGVVRAMPANQGNLPGPEIYRRALDVVVRQKVMVLRAKQEHLDQDPALIRQGQIAFERIISDAWLKRQSDAAVNDQALHALYNQEYAGQTGAEEVHARIILVPTEQEAMSIIASLRNGADFGDLAQSRSRDPTAAKGGDLGYITRDATVPELAAVMFSLAPGQVTAYPVATFVGYFVVRVEGRRNRAPLTFEEARLRLEHELRAEAVKTAIGRLLANVKLVQPANAEGNGPAKP